MRIVFFGSSHGYPEQNRRCSCSLVEAGGKRYFIDMGTNAAECLATRRIPIEAIDSVFVTHMHGDHTHGLIPFVDLITWYFKTPDPVICLPMPEAAKVLQDW